MAADSEASAAASTTSTSHQAPPVLPAAVLLHVFARLPTLRDLACAARVNALWRSVSATDSLWRAHLLAEHDGCMPTLPQPQQQQGAALQQHAASARNVLRRLHTSSLWATGRAAAGLACATSSSGTPSSRGGGATCVWMWSADSRRSSCCSGDLESSSSSSLLGPAPAGFAVSAVAAAGARGPLGCVLLGASGSIVRADTPRGPAAAAAVADGGAGQPPGEDPGLQRCSWGVTWRPASGVRVASIAAGDGHMLAVTCDGRVFGWGANDAGQLGLGSCHAWQATPAGIPAAAGLDGDAIVAAAAGGSHSVLLTASGAVVMSGANEAGQCAQDPVLVPKSALFCAPQPHAPPPAAAIAAGPGTTLVATRAGRVLACGDSSSGQCGPGVSRQLRGGAACITAVLTDLGPDTSWHGLARPTAAQVAAAGGDVAAALPRVVQLAAGAGCCVALTEGGQVFAWGQGGKGQLGIGGCPKLQAVPARLPWAQRITGISCSLRGGFGAAIDAAGRLWTWGAGRGGQLGHGDVSKRCVGRAVRALRDVHVHQVCCGPDGMLVVASQRWGSSMAAAAGGAGGDTPARQTVQQPDQLGRAGRRAAAAAAAAAGSSCTHFSDDDDERVVTWPEDAGSPGAPGGLLEPDPLLPAGPSVSSSSGQRAHPRRRQPTLADVAAVRYAPAAATASSTDAATAAAVAPPARGSRRRPSHHAPDSEATSSSSASSATTSSSRPPRQAMDKGFKRLLRRVLTGFMADSRQRELNFPASLSAVDRYHVHATAEAWGLGHASQGEGEARVVKVWKVSCARRAAHHSSAGGAGRGGWASDSE